MRPTSKGRGGRERERRKEGRERKREEGRGEEGKRMGNGGKRGAPYFFISYIRLKITLTKRKVKKV